jgi:hypothetical protein
VKKLNASCSIARCLAFSFTPSTSAYAATLMCGDLFTQLGDGPALIQGDIVGPAIAGEDLFSYSSLNPG